jgi:hypothetical protein
MKSSSSWLWLFDEKRKRDDMFFDICQLCFANVTSFFELSFVFCRIIINQLLSRVTIRFFNWKLFSKRYQSWESLGLFGAKLYWRICGSENEPVEYFENVQANAQDNGKCTKNIYPTIESAKMSLLNVVLT